MTDLTPKPNLLLTPAGSNSSSEGLIIPGRTGLTPPKILKPTENVRRPELCLAVEEFATRLSDTGNLIYTSVTPDHLLMRAIDAGKTYGPCAPGDNRKSDTNRYIGQAPDGAPAAKDGLHCGTLTAVDREMLYYLTKTFPSVMRPGSVFLKSSWNQLSAKDFHLLTPTRHLQIPSVDRTLLVHRNHPSLKKIEDRFGVNSSLAIIDPSDYSFTRGFGRALAGRQKGLAYETARRFPGEYGAGFRNMLFFGEKSVTFDWLRATGVIKFSANGAMAPGFSQVLNRKV